MTYRKHMPRRRHQLTREVDFQGVKWTVGLGYYEDGTVGEFFIDGPPNHTGSKLDRLTDDIAICLSLCLQLGIDPKKLAAAFSTEPVWVNGEETEGNSTIVGEIAQLAVEARPEIERLSKVLETYNAKET